MRAEQIKTFVLVLTACLSLSGPSNAQSQDELPDELPGIEPLEGLPAELDNEQEFEEATNSLSDGLVAIEDVILNEGLRRAIANDEVMGGSVNQLGLEAAAETLRSCKDSCDTPEERCRDRADNADPDTLILLATACEIEFRQCQAQCTQNLVDAVANIPDISGDAVQDQQNDDAAMEQQREVAIQAMLLRDLEDATLVAQGGINDLLNVALDEGIRTTLEEYEEYGVPPGETALVTATNDTFECEDENDDQVDECEDNAENGLATTLLGWAACNIGGFIDDIDECGGRLIDRYTR